MQLTFSDGNGEGTIKVSNGVSPFVIQWKGRLFGRSLLLACFLLGLLEFTGNKGKWLSYFNLTAVLALGLLFCWLISSV